MNKFLLSSFIFVLLFAFVSCSDGTTSNDSSSDSEETSTNMTIDYTAAKSNYGTYTIVCSSETESYSVQDGIITLAPVEEDVEYTITGYFKGQIINNTKNTVIILNNAYLENTSGEPVILGNKKTEIKAAVDSVNYVINSGTNESKTAAVYCEKNLKLGGSGTTYVVGSVTHGIKGDEVSVKGSGTWYIQGTTSGSAINCDVFSVDKEKEFTAYIINSKNGIKADEYIDIASGTYYFYDNKTALKTDTSEDDDGEPVEHYITLSGGTFTFKDNTSIYSTEEGAYSTSGATIN